MDTHVEKERAPAVFRLADAILVLLVGGAIAVGTFFGGAFLYSYDNGSFLGAYTSILGPLILGNTLWVTDIIGVSPNLLIRIMLGSLLLGFLLVSFLRLLSSKGAPPHPRRYSRSAWVCAGLVAMGMLYTTCRDEIICPPEIRSEIVGVTAEESAMNYFAGVAHGERSTIAIEPYNESADGSVDDGPFLPSVKLFTASGSGRASRMIIGVAPIEDYPRCRGWRLAYTSELKSLR